MSPRPASLIHIGTSGWSYGHWRGPFYPPELREDRWLAFYAAQLGSVEINNSFYRLPAPETLTGWRDAVPEGFVFSVKASRFITHMKKLKEPEATLAPFFARIAGLAPKLGPVLFQLPPRWRLDLPRLGRFLATLPAGYRHAFEFRDPSWWVAPVHELLARHGVALCIHDLNGVLSPMEVTGDFVYVRLHGPGSAYRGDYGEALLAAWADRCSAWAEQGRHVFCYFDNDQAGYAALNALRLREMLGAAPAG